MSEMPFAKTGLRRAIPLVCALLALLASGCVGLYKNSDLFALPPAQGQKEAELFTKYGAPAFSQTLDDTNYYVYKVRDNKYIILVGVFEGHDIVITCQKGVVTTVNRVERPKAFSLFAPVVWADTD